MKQCFGLKFLKRIIASDLVKYLGHMIRNNSIGPLKDYLI